MIVRMCNLCNAASRSTEPWRFYAPSIPASMPLQPYDHEVSAKSSLALTVAGGGSNLSGGYHTRGQASTGPSLLDLRLNMRCYRISEFDISSYRASCCSLRKTGLYRSFAEMPKSYGTMPNGEKGVVHARSVFVMCGISSQVTLDLESISSLAIAIYCFRSAGVIIWYHPRARQMPIPLSNSGFLDSLS